MNTHDYRRRRDVLCLDVVYVDGTKYSVLRVYTKALIVYFIYETGSNVEGNIKCKREKIHLCQVN